MARPHIASPPPPPRLGSIREVAAYLGVSARSVERLIAAQQLSSRRLGRRRLVDWASAERLTRRDTPVIGPEAHL